MPDLNIWMNGKLVPQEEAVLPVNSAAVFYATNVFEGLRAYWNDRTTRSCTASGWTSTSSASASR